MQTPPVLSAVEGKIIAVQLADLHLIFSTIMPFTQVALDRLALGRRSLLHPERVDIRFGVHWQHRVSTKLRPSVACSLFPCRGKLDRRRRASTGIPGMSLTPRFPAALAATAQ